MLLGVKIRIIRNKTLVLEYKYRLKTTELKAEIKHVNSNLYFVSGGTKKLLSE